MPNKIKIITEKVKKIAILNDSPMAKALWSFLPFEAFVNRWGEEIYFSIPLKEIEGEKKKVVNKGDIAFWPLGRTFCIFFGPTPTSTGKEIRPASEVILLGKIVGDVEEFKKVKDKEKIIIDKEI